MPTPNPRPITTLPGGPVDKPVKAIAKRLGVSDDQVLLAWTKAKGAVVVTTSSKKERLLGYLNAGDLGAFLPPFLPHPLAFCLDPNGPLTLPHQTDLTDEEITAIDEAGALDRGTLRPWASSFSLISETGNMKARSQYKAQLAGILFLMTVLGVWVWFAHGCGRAM